MIERRCARCGRRLLSLEQIYQKLTAAPDAARARAEHDYMDQTDRNAYAFGHLAGAVEEIARDLACHSGACQKGKPS